jgi:ribosomal protein L29
MKKKELISLRGKKIPDLEKLASARRKEVLLTRAKVKAGQEKNLKKVKSLKKDLAQILTVIKELELREKLGSEMKKESKKKAKKSN